MYYRHTYIYHMYINICIIIYIEYNGNSMNSEAIPNFPRRWRFGPVGGRGSVALAADAADTAGGAVSSSNDWGFLMELDFIEVTFGR